MDISAHRDRLLATSQDPEVKKLVEHALSKFATDELRIINSDIGKLEQQGVLNPARDLAELALRCYPENIFFVVKYVTLLIKTDNLQSATTVIADYKARCGEQSNPRFRFLEATIHKHNKRFDDAIRIFQELDRPENEQFYIKPALAECYYLAGDNESARATLKDSKLSPDGALLLAKIHFQEQDARTAARILRPFLGSSGKIDAFFRDYLAALDTSESVAQPSKPEARIEPETGPGYSGVFLVHGRSEGVKEKVARFLEKLSIPVTILHEQPSLGKTVLEKLAHYSNVGYAVVLLTGDDRGGLWEAPYDGQLPRARQNVVLELGFFLAQLGRERVCALVEESVELPSDYHGVVFIKLDSADAWKLSLAKEMRGAGLPIDLNRAM